MPAPLVELKRITLHPDGRQTLSQQLYLAIKQQILSGIIVVSTKLPASRALAKELGIGRNTVISAYEQLRLEGYIETTIGSGSYVATTLPENWHHADNSTRAIKIATKAPPLGNRYQQLKPWQDNWGQGTSDHQLFTVGLPDLREFPHKLWNKLAQQHSMSGLQSLMGFGDPAGYKPLREAVADYVRTSRAVNCNADNILITTGAQQALSLCSFLLLSNDDHAVIEEPGYRGARYALLAHGATLQAIHVDADGLDLDKLERLKTCPKVVYCTPANQYPTGATLALQKRGRLLNWATNNNSWIIEDDYDSEYLYRNRPLASLQGLAQNQQVIYMGSFSKVLFPALRLGYLVLPKALLPAFTRCKMEQGGETPLHTQAVTAAFIQEGHFARHIKRMRLHYHKKLQFLHDCCEKLKPWAELQQRDAGMHAVLRLNDTLDENLLRQALLAANLQCSLLSDYYYNKPSNAGLVLGFAGCSLEEIKDGIALIKQCLSRAYK